MTFIDQLAPFAIKHGRAHGVLPSLIIAQGILESASGTSELAIKANNLFGIKSGSGWFGDVYTKRTAEHKTDGTIIYPDADFRKYPTFEGAVIDLCGKYVNGTGWESHNRYEAVLNQTDYKKATAAVKDAGYATDVNYPEMLNKLIEQYELTKYDKEGDNVAYTIINSYIPESLYKLKAPYTMKPEYVTIHNTYNDATAANEIAYMTRNNTVVGYHVAIDDKQAVQAIPFTRNAYHAGDGQGKGNRASIGIEICYSKSGGPKYVAAEENTVEYVAHVLKQYGWGIDRVKWHRDWSGKNCPHRIIEEGRTQSVKDRIAAKLKELNNPAPQKEVEELKFSSPTLKSETETSLLSKAHRQIIVAAAIKAGAHASWADKLGNNTLTDADVLGLAVKYTVAVNK